MGIHPFCLRGLGFVTMFVGIRSKRAWGIDPMLPMLKKQAGYASVPGLFGLAAR